MTCPEPPVFAIARSEDSKIASASVAVLLLVFGSVTPLGGTIVAALVKLPVAVGTTVPVIDRVAVPLANKETITLTEPVPLADAQLEPLEAVHVHETAINLSDITSVNSELVTALGPLLVATIV